MSVSHWLVWLLGMSNQNSGPYMFWSGIGSSLRDVVFLWLILEIRLTTRARADKWPHDPLWQL